MVGTLSPLMCRLLCFSVAVRRDRRRGRRRPRHGLRKTIRLRQEEKEEVSIAHRDIFCLACTDFVRNYQILFATSPPCNAVATFIQSTRTQFLFKKSSKPCHVGIHWIALAEYSQMSTHVPGFQSFFRFFASF